MKKIISVLAIAAFTFGMAQEAPKKDCCAGKDKKDCKMSKKECKMDKKECDMKGKTADHKDCKMDPKTGKKACCDMKSKKAA